MRAPIGIRIRRRRLQMNMSQVALARAAEVSPSYLNLIENNKRDVGGRLLLRIAEQLGLGIEDLSGDPEQRSLHAIQEVLNDPLLHGTGFEQTDLRDLVARFPEVAKALTLLHRASGDANAELEAYANRLDSDPLLSQMLHEVLSRITAMRSSAEILSGVEDLAPRDRSRFAGSITREARDLSETIQGLASYFDLASSRRRSISPVREVEDAFIAANNHFPELEEVAETLRAEILQSGAEFGEAALAEALHRRFAITCRRWRETARDVSGGKRMTGQVRFDDGAERVLWLRGSTTAATRQFQMCRLYAQQAAAEQLSRVCEGFDLTSDDARRLALGALTSYAAGAMVMPYKDFLSHAEERHYDIDLLSHSYTASFEQVAHRLVTLRRKGAEGVPFGFLRADPAGQLTKRFPLPGLTLPGSGHGCLLWPLYAAAGAQGVIRQIAEFTNGARFLLVAKSVSKRVEAWHEQPLVFSIMLACDLLHADRTVYGRGLDLSDAATRVPVGPSCLLCVRDDCSHRQKAASR
ncbi:DUF2083 domain-containing protein [Paracoccus sp. Z118]|uniref:XRE family transcriptional regulator n=1 Tax=Paracoccus sp. Z118 TaxID=2851017 RepID=UPI001C2B9DEC|nr:XRE family transcriptional regulator [Paracoccus sp. Z118]MBV0890871.1 DUF2083 domain-containing protein [Paracoccus sp. Z118]